MDRMALGKNATWEKCQAGKNATPEKMPRQKKCHTGKNVTRDKCETQKRQREEIFKRWCLKRLEIHAKWKFNTTQTVLLPRNYLPLKRPSQAKKSPSIFPTLSPSNPTQNF